MALLQFAKSVSSRVFTATGNIPAIIPAIPNMFTTSSISGLSLDAAGLIALADLGTISERTALIGTASFLDVFMLAPGIHRHQDASRVNGGELPITGAMTSGYVFRVENQGTVSFLQKIGETGCLVTVRVSEQVMQSRWLPSGLATSGIPAAILYLLGVLLPPLAVVILGVIRDFWAGGVLLLLMLARLINVVVIKRRTVIGWKGAKEEGVEGDLMILLSQDRWIRMRGLVDDLKAVTSGQWLRDKTSIEGFATALATLLVYVSAALASNASTVGSLMIAGLLLVSVALLGLCNSMTEKFQMFCRVIYKEGETKRYTRRMDMAKEFIASSGRDDWAIGMGLIVPPAGRPHAVGV